MRNLIYLKTVLRSKSKGYIVPHQLYNYKS
jgi:hypothetical protein